jgi:sirohydrochlorin cobaltochelatase
VKQGILLVAHGTSAEGAAKGMDQIYRELKGKCADEPVYQAYYGKVSLERMDRSKAETPVNSLEEAMEQIAADGIESLHVFPAMLLGGPKYDRILACMDKYRDRIPNITVADPLLCTQVGETEIVHVLRRILVPVSNKDYLVVAHVNNEKTARVYQAIVDHFQRHDLTNVHVMFLKGSPDVHEIISHIRKEELVIFPFMVFSGRHVEKDIFGPEDSVSAELRRRGYRTTVIRKGLAEYPEFRQLFYMSWGIGFR